MCQHPGCHQAGNQILVLACIYFCVHDSSCLCGRSANLSNRDNVLKPRLQKGTTHGLATICSRTCGGACCHLPDQECPPEKRVRRQLRLLQACGESAERRLLGGRIAAKDPGKKLKQHPHCPKNKFLLSSALEVRQDAGRWLK